jgi:membrane-bound lytic murein transglycosylase D
VEEPHVSRPQGWRGRAAALALAAAAAVAALAGCATAPVPAPVAVPAQASQTAASGETAATREAPAADAATAQTDAWPPGAPTALATAPARPTDNPHIEEQSDLWLRLRAGFTLPTVEGDLVRKWEQFYAARPDYVQRMATRGGRYLFHIVEEVQRRGLPTELALLPFVESAFNPQASSRTRASGIWQFMPATGKDFELRQNVFRDDRRDVLASTQAALDYLQRLHAQFGDWHLALAAYNWGQGNVQRAQARNRKAGKPTDYASLRMPDETRNYVPKLQAVTNLVADPARHGLLLPALGNHPYFVSVPVARDIDVALAAQLAGLPLEDFQQLNPQLNKPVVLAAGTPQLLLPYDNANRFLHEAARHTGPMASWTAWVVPRTLKPADAAHAVGMSEQGLREVNHIPARMKLLAGSVLLVPRKAHTEADVTGHLADHGAMALVSEARPARKRAAKGVQRSPQHAAAAATAAKPVRKPAPTKRHAQPKPPTRVAHAAQR